MLVSKEVIEWASQLGWKPILRVIGEDGEGFPITEEGDIECFITDDGDPDYWYGVPIPGTQGFKYASPEEIIEMYNYDTLCYDAPTPGNL